MYKWCVIWGLCIVPQCYESHRQWAWLRRWRWVLEQQRQEGIGEYFQTWVKKKCNRRWMESQRHDHVWFSVWASVTIVECKYWKLTPGVWQVSSHQWCLCREVCSVQWVVSFFSLCTPPLHIPKSFLKSVLHAVSRALSYPALKYKAQLLDIVIPRLSCGSHLTLIFQVPDTAVFFHPWLDLFLLS